VEIGPRDVRNNQAVLVRRDTREKQMVALPELTEAVARTLDTIQADLFQRALRFREAHTGLANSAAEFREVLRDRPGFLRAHWCGRATCEDSIKADTGATIRCIALDEPEEVGVCLVCGEPSQKRAVFARAY